MPTDPTPTDSDTDRFNLGSRVTSKVPIRATALNQKSEIVIRARILALAFRAHRRHG